MNFIELLKQDFTTQQEVIQLPYYLTSTLKGYEKAGDIDMEDFIISSTKNFLENSGRLTKNNIGELNFNNTLPLLIHIPITLSLRLWWIGLRLKVTKSELIHEALGHSISMLMDRVEAQEDYMIERLQEK